MHDDIPDFRGRAGDRDCVHADSDYASFDGWIATIHIRNHGYLLARCQPLRVAGVGMLWARGCCLAGYFQGLLPGSSAHVSQNHLEARESLEGLREAVRLSEGLPSLAGPEWAMISRPYSSHVR